MNKKPTIQMIADMAGVSRGTVDRVLNNRSYVKEDVRERILEIVKETGYVHPREIHIREGLEQLRPLKLGVLLPNFENQFLDEVQIGIRKARQELAETGVDVIVKRCRTDLPDEAVSLLQEMQSLGVHGLSVCALHDRTITSALLSLKEEGIPCITFNSDLPESGRLLFVGQDIQKSGRIAAELMSKCIRPGEKILAAVGNLKFDGHSKRLLGFRERLAELGFPEEDLFVAETFNDYRTTVTKIHTAIREIGELRGIYMANLSVTGCAQAILEAGKKGQIHLVCHDINEGVRQLLKEGLVDFTIPQDFVYQGSEPLLLLAHYLRKNELPKQDPAAGAIQVLCAENMN